MRGIVIALVFGLAACGSPRDEDKLTPEMIARSQSADELPEIALSNDPEPAPAPEPVANEADLTNGLGEPDELAPEDEMQAGVIPIPSAFRGRWGMSVDDCMSPRRPGSMALEISGGVLGLPEGQGRLFQTLGNFPERYVGIFNYEGDRGRWSVTEELSLTGSSNVLVRQVDGGTLRYRRCTRTGG